MRRFDKRTVITEANQRLENEFLKSKVLIKENEEPSLNKVEIDIISKILEGDILGEGEEILNEGSFSDIRQKFNSALKKGAMSFSILAAVLGSPNMAQAQKAQLKKDVTDSTWFLDSQESFKNNPRVYSQLMGKNVDNPNFDQDLKDKREVGTWNVYSVENWVNNLGQDSTVYKQYQDRKYVDTDDGGAVEYSNLSEPVKTIVNKDDVKAWKGDGWSEVTKKGNVANYYWTEDGKTSITPSQWKGLQKVEKLTKDNKTDKLQDKLLKDKSMASGKRLMDKGFKSSDFYKVDLDQIDSPGK